jgi:hypothetical protein
LGTLLYSRDASSLNKQRDISLDNNCKSVAVIILINHLIKSGIRFSAKELPEDKS